MSLTYFLEWTWLSINALNLKWHQSWSWSGCCKGIWFVFKRLCSWGRGPRFMGLWLRVSGLLRVFFGRGLNRQVVLDLSSISQKSLFLYQFWFVWRRDFSFNLKLCYLRFLMLLSLLVKLYVEPQSIEIPLDSWFSSSGGCYYYFAITWIFSPIQSLFHHLQRYGSLENYKNGGHLSLNCYIYVKIWGLVRNEEIEVRRIW